MTQIRSLTGAIRIVGYSPAADFVLTVIAVRIDGELWASRRGRQQAQNGAVTRRQAITIRSEADINRLLASAAAEYADEERAAAEEESHAATASTVFSVRLQPAV